MAITFPLALPAPFNGVAHMATIHGSPIVASSQNPFTGRRETFEWGGIWTLEIVLKTMRRSSAADWIAFLTALKGPSGSFLAGPPGYGGPRGTATGTPVVDGGSQTGATLATTGWTAGVTDILKAGDFFSLGSAATTHLYRVLQDANSDGSGDASIEIWPSLREVPSGGASIEVLAPMGHWYLDGNGVPESLEPGGLDSNGDPDPFVTLAFAAREVV